VLRKIMELPWKGNIRELKNVIERAVLLADGPVIDGDCFAAGDIGGNAGTDPHPSKPVVLKKAVAEAEKMAIRRALKLAGGNRSKAAVMLGIGRRTLYDKLAVYQIDD
jgi:DNA-binding NtrC family response regulator